jgi:hypothetical protein
MSRIPRALALAALLAAAPRLAAAGAGGPSHAAFKGCKWEKLSDPALGLEAWVQRCDYGFRKIDFFLKGRAIFERFSDGGEPEALVEVLDLAPGETPEAGVNRVFAEHTEKSLAARCVMKPYRDWPKPPAGVKRYTFLPNAAYQKEVDAKASPDEVGEPACGEWGGMPDGVQYFETQPKSGARKILFVRVGQDDPLFDEKTLKLLPAK